MVVDIKVTIGGYMQAKKSHFFSLRSFSAAARLLEFVGNRQKGKNWVKLYYPQKRKDRNNFCGNFARLKQKGFLESKKVGNKYFGRLTEIGLLEFLRLKMDAAVPFSDDRVCLVVFDVPETKRKIREKLRQLLWACGFFPIQKSVWLSQFDSAASLVELFGKFGLGQWIKVFNAEEKSHRHK